MNEQKQKHTPGPWKAEKLGYDGFRITYNHKDGIKRYLCHGHEEKNAALIAAAPDLLNMLQRMVDLVQHVQRMIDETGGGGSPCLLTLEQARAAIRKAKGEG